jgi:hypothetical protein
MAIEPMDGEPVPLTLPLTRVGFIIAKAREYDAEVAPVDEESGSNPTDDDSRDILESTADNPTRQELTDAIGGLNEDERVELVALMWLGRGDFDAGEWPEAVKLARERHNNRDPDYLAGTPLLADYLEEGLAQLGYATKDVAEAETPSPPVS